MKNIYFLVICCLLAGCKKYQVQYEGPYDPSQTITTFSPYEYLYILNNHVYVTTLKFAQTKMISKFNEQAILASINSQHTKVAYKEANKNIIITDNEGKFIDSIPGTEDVVSFDWQVKSSVFYMLRPDGKISFWNGTIAVATTNLSTLVSGTNVFKELVILEDNRLLFHYYRTASFADYLYMISPSGVHIENLGASGLSNVNNLKAEIRSDGSVLGTFSYYNGGDFYAMFNYENSNDYSVFDTEFGIGVIRTTDYTKFEYDPQYALKIFYKNAGISYNYYLPSFSDEVTILDIN